jgi:hypothetical protein
MSTQISAEDSGSHSLLRDDGSVEERVAGPVIAMGLGVDDVPELSAPLDLAFQPHSVARLVRRIDQDDAVRRHNDAVISAFQLGLNKNISRELFHASPTLPAPIPLEPALLAVILSASEGFALLDALEILKEKKQILRRKLLRMTFKLRRLCTERLEDSASYTLVLTSILIVRDFGATPKWL